MLKLFTPREIINELDKYIIGQNKAKKVVAVALRNRWRRQQLEEHWQNEVVPKNILMIGPTGVGKTAIAKRLAKLDNSPFVKVEATKFTEVGYVGKDVEQIIRDLLENAIQSLTKEQKKDNIHQAKEMALNKVTDIVAGEKSSADTKNLFKQKIVAGEINDTEIDIQVKDKSNNVSPFADIPGMQGAQIGMISLEKMLGKENLKTKKVTIKQALNILEDEYADSLLDMDNIIKQALYNTENHGIVFIDEIDKIVSGVRTQKNSSDVSREGVQRDLLPLVEGTSVTTKYGVVNTDHILFIASGAFQISKPSDLLPELQGRLPVRVELEPLTKIEFVKILTETDFNLIDQATLMLATEGVKLKFSPEAIAKIAEITEYFNINIENTGARRLYTIIEQILADINFDATDQEGAEFEITADYVEQQLSDLTMELNLAKYVI